MEKHITVLPARPKLIPQKRVAAYARVSSGKDAMLHSLATQVAYYSSYIKRHPGWVYAGVYADEARTGTKDERPEFQRLLADCRNGHIDLILTKSISRFSRNTVTTLNTVRELKALNIDVYFEEQRIHSLSGEGELMLTIMSAFAQEESWSASENQKWRVRNAFKNGELINMTTLFGYDTSQGLTVNPAQADVIREMYARLNRGDSLTSIAHWLNDNNIRGPYGGKWKASRVRDVLLNEKYTGNSLLQKSYTNNHIDKKRLPNHGRLPQYFATETHPAIIDQATYDTAQAALQRIHTGKPTNTPEPHHIFTGMVICGKCGKPFKYVKSHGLTRLACPTYYEQGKEFCPCRKIPEDALLWVAGRVLKGVGRGRPKSAPEMDDLDESAFRAAVDHITVFYPDRLVFHMKDGRKLRRKWKAESRSNSWTPEMRLQAAEHARKRYSAQDSSVQAEASALPAAGPDA